RFAGMNASYTLDGAPTPTCVIKLQPLKYNTSSPLGGPGSNGNDQTLNPNSH
ncbi:hypothetical protein TNCT_15161, partial [Trichonephila clavata]